MIDKTNNADIQLLLSEIKDLIKMMKDSKLRPNTHFDPYFKTHFEEVRKKLEATLPDDDNDPSEDCDI
jgi:hypothetical protein